MNDEISVTKFWLVVIGIFFCLLVAYGTKTTAEGEKVGVIVKLAQQGLFIKTYEAELIRGGLADGSGNIGSPFYFTIKDKKVIEEAKNALDHSHKVKIHYYTKLFSPLQSDSGNNFVDYIEAIEK